MFPTSSFTGASAGAGIGQSHRGVDLGPMRLSMPGGLLRRNVGRGHSDIATALAVRWMMMLMMMAMVVVMMNDDAGDDDDDGNADGDGNCDDDDAADDDDGGGGDDDDDDDG